MSDTISLADFRLGLEYGLEQDSDLTLRERFGIKRALRRPRALERLYERMLPRLDSFAAGLGAAAFDFQSFLEWIVANWPEIIKMIAAIIALF